MSPLLFSVLIISSISDSVSPFCCAVLYTVSVGISFPCVFSRSRMSSFIRIILLLWLAGISVAILSISIVPVFSSKATCFRQWSRSSIAFLASFFSTFFDSRIFALASDSRTSPSSCRALIPIDLLPPAWLLIFR